MSIGRIPGDTPSPTTENEPGHKPGRELILLEKRPLPVKTSGGVTTETSGKPPGEVDARRPRPDIRRLTPRQIGEVGMDLYVKGVIAWEEYSLLAFQSELHPDYERTIGALTGEKAEPDRPRDYVALWEERLAFERRHNSADDDRVRRAQRIVDVLRRLDKPTNLLA